MSALGSPIPGRCRIPRPRFAQASPIARRLAADIRRIEFTVVWDHVFASGCSPPRLAATQLPSASSPEPGSATSRLSLTGLHVFMITRAAPSCRRGSTYPENFRRACRKCPTRHIGKLICRPSFSLGRRAALKGQPIVFSPSMRHRVDPSCELGQVEPVLPNRLQLSLDLLHLQHQ